MTYLGEGGKIPYLRKDDIADEALNVLEECSDGPFPVDVEAICDNLGIGIFPIIGLSRNFRVDAFISADFKTIYVDSREFEKDSHRYRFSLAHELGHFILHKKYCPDGVDDLKEWFRIFRRFINNYAEFQANYFAGSMLVPESELVRILDEEFDGSFVKNGWNKNHEEFKDVLYNVRKLFMVSEQMMARRVRDTFLGSEAFDEIADAIRW